MAFVLWNSRFKSQGNTNGLGHACHQRSFCTLASISADFL